MLVVMFLTALCTHIWSLERGIARTVMICPHSAAVLCDQLAVNCDSWGPGDKIQTFVILLLSSLQCHPLIEFRMIKTSVTVLMQLSAVASFAWAMHYQMYRIEMPERLSGGRNMGDHSSKGD